MKVKVGAFLYDLDWADGVKADDGKSLYGQIEYDCEKIHINTKYSEQKQRVSILHEILHAIDDVVGWQIKENLIHTLAIQLIDLCDNNPELMTILFPQTAVPGPLNCGKPLKEEQT
jgi:hypothetical protein